MTSSRARPGESENLLKKKQRSTGSLPNQDRGNHGPGQQDIIAQSHLLSDTQQAEGRSNSGLRDSGHLSELGWGRHMMANSPPPAGPRGPDCSHLREEQGRPETLGKEE